MSPSRHTWEERYRARGDRPAAAPSSFLERHVDALPKRGPALDVACGDGRNALLLARRGLTVDAVDVAGAALRRLRESAADEGLLVHPIQADLEAFPMPSNRYAVIVNIRYLQRTLWPQLTQALRVGGVLVFETFLDEQRRIGHPTNPAFLLARGELANAFPHLETLSYEEGLLESESEPAYLARLLARRTPR